MLETYSEDKLLPLLGTAIQKLSIACLWDALKPHNYQGEAATAQHFFQSHCLR